MGIFIYVFPSIALLSFLNINKALILASIKQGTCFGVYACSRWMKIIQKKKLVKNSASTANPTTTILAWISHMSKKIIWCFF